MIGDPDHFDVDGRDLFGLAALHKLSAWDKPDLLALLLPAPSPSSPSSLHQRADPLLKTRREGFNCLHCCVDMRAQRSLVWLLDAALAPLTRAERRQLRGGKDEKGRTPLELALEMVPETVEAASDPLVAILSRPEEEEEETDGADGVP